MRAGSIVARLIALPLRHKLMAVGIEVAFITGCLVWARHLPRLEYTSSALLSFDEFAAAHLASGGVQTDHQQAAALAESVLSDEVLKTLCWQLGLPQDPSGGEAARFRSGLMLSQDSPSKLRVTWRGDDRGQAMAVANAVAVLLASWIPEDARGLPSDSVAPLPDPAIALTAPTEPTPRMVEVMDRLSRQRAHRESVLREQKQLRFEIATADQRLAAIGEEVRRLEASIRQVNAERETEAAARQPLVAVLDADQKKLDVLRARYTDAYPDVEAAQERIVETEKKLATMPAVRPAPDADQSRLVSTRKEMNNLGAERERLLHQLLEKASLEMRLRNQDAEGSAQATRLDQASPEPQAVQSKPVLSGPAAAAALTAPSAQTTNSADSDRLRPFMVLEPAADAEGTDGRYLVLNWLLGVVGPLCGILYLVFAVWWFRVVRDVEALERVVPDDVAYLGAIPGMNTWRRNV
jgi:hypothetical protein